MARQADCCWPKKASPPLWSRHSSAPNTAGPSAASWLKSLQLIFPDRRVVRYAEVYALRTGQWLGTWTPTHQVSMLPTEVGIQLPTGELGLYFSAGKPS